MLYNLRFFCSKCSLFHNANLFGSCIIHILYTGCAEILSDRAAMVGLQPQNAAKRLPDICRSKLRALN